MRKTLRQKGFSTSKGVLQELGLSYGAEEAYLTLLQNGPSLISGIARTAGQFRVDSYRYVDELVRHGLIKVVLRGKRKYFEASSPESILSVLKAKEERVSEGVTAMLKFFDRQQKGFSAEFFAGKTGIHAVYELLLKDARKNSKLYRIESPYDYTWNKKYYPREYWKRASSKGGDLEKMVITNPATHQTRQRKLNRFSKSIPVAHSPFIFDYTTIILGEKVAFIDYELEEALLMKDKRFADYMRSIFLMLYERL